MSAPRVCGSCRLCCKLPAVWEEGTHADGTAYEFRKPQGTWCRHAGPGGCAIWGKPEKPIGCRIYSCQWLQGYGPDEARPDRSHAVVSLEMFEGVLQLTIYEDRERAADTPLVREVIVAATAGRAHVITAWMAVPASLREPRRRILLATGQTQRLLRTPDDVGLPPAPTDVTRERARIDRVLGPGASDRPHIPTAELTEAILRSRLTYEDASR